MSLWKFSLPGDYGEPEGPVQLQQRTHHGGVMDLKVKELGGAQFVFAASTQGSATIARIKEPQGKTQLN